MKALKPGYRPEAVQAELVRRVCDYFGRVYDNAEEERHRALRGHRPGDEKWAALMGSAPTIRETAEAFGLSAAKIRKILITGGAYDTEMYRAVRDAAAEGLTAEQIGEKLGIRPVTARSYLPYERVIYNLPERSVNADRLVRFRERWGGYKAK